MSSLPSIGQFQDNPVSKLGDPKQRSKMLGKSYRVIALDERGLPLKPNALTEEQAQEVVLWAKMNAPRVSKPFNVSGPLASLVKRVQIIEDQQIGLKNTQPLHIAAVAEHPAQKDKTPLGGWDKGSCLSCFITKALETLPPNASLPEIIQATVKEIHKEFPRVPPPRKETFLEKQLGELAGSFVNSLQTSEVNLSLKRHSGDRDWEFSMVLARSSALRECSFRNDKNFVLDVVRANGLSLYHVSKELSNDPEIVSVAVEQEGHDALEYASEELRNNKAFMLDMVGRCLNALQCASPGLRNDPEVVLAAVGLDGENFRWASPELRNNKEFVLEVVRKNQRALAYVPTELQSDLDVRRAAGLK